jgi:hypothetical protein
VEGRRNRLLEKAEHIFVLQEMSWLEAAGGDFPAHEVAGVFDAFDQAEELLRNPRQIPHFQIRKDYMECLPEHCPLKPIPIAEMGGKIRSVTLHPAEEVQVARELTQRWLGSLRTMVTTRDMLTNREVRLKAQGENPRLFSADLSAATDYIPHSLAQCLARLLCKRLKRPQDVAICEKLFGPKELPDGRHTKNGIHMGLGPTWVLLSLLNSFSAWNAGAKRHSYAVCGDDLIGYWNTDIINRYQTCLIRLGLVVNKTKSYISRHGGVFCERLVEPTKDREAVARDVGHLSALTNGKLYFGKSSDRHACASGLGGMPHPQIWKPARQRLIPRGVGSGPVRFGGNGAGALTLTGLQQALHKGALSRKGEPLSSETRRAIRQDETRCGQVSTADFLIYRQTAIRLGALQNGKPPKEPGHITNSAWRKRSRMNNPRSQSVNAKGLLCEILASSLPHAAKRTAYHILAMRSRHRTPSKADRKWLLQVISAGPAKRFITTELAVALLERETGIGLQDQIRRRHGRSARLGNTPLQEPPHGSGAQFTPDACHGEEQKGAPARETDSS